MDNLRRLEEMFSKFPGIGPRQARRFVYYIMTRNPSYMREFVDLLSSVRQSANECASCHRIFISNQITDRQTTGGQKNLECDTCQDPNRDGRVLLVVARDSDFENIEKSGAYHGLYFILGGSVPVLDKEPDKRIRLEMLLNHVSKVSKAGFSEIIISMNATPEGEHTGRIVKEALQRILPNVKITELGRGISTGAELEYIDGDTIKSALEGRK